MSFVTLILLWPLTLSAELTPEGERLAHSIFESIFSPYCPGRILNDCPSSQAHELKNDIREKISSGMSRDQIVADLYSRFGNAISAIPEKKGFGLIAWFTPFAFLLAGAVFVVLWLQVRRKSSPATNSPHAKLSTEMEKRIEKELEG